MEEILIIITYIRWNGNRISQDFTLRFNDGQEEDFSPDSLKVLIGQQAYNRLLSAIVANAIDWCGTWRSISGS
jgi:hypothetical protein